MAADRVAAPGKTVLIDSSSAIIIFKAGIIEHVIDFYSVAIATSVYHELTREGYAGADEFRTYCNESKIWVLSDAREIRNITEKHEAMEGLGAGEKDTILLYQKGFGEFIIIDDGRGAQYCKKNGIPYINALLVPRLFFKVGWIDLEEKNRFMDGIIEHGRYASWVIEYARSCDDKELAYFG
ncbi:MAG: hypothetical protein KA369_03230 [Spirochaetes bacterium]|nr:hypothetical protein [Spirochaetota bacterium]